jgi:hypothetical protein
VTPVRDRKHRGRPLSLRRSTTPGIVTTWLACIRPLPPGFSTVCASLSFIICRPISPVGCITYPLPGPQNSGRCTGAGCKTPRPGRSAAGGSSSPGAAPPISRFSLSAAPVASICNTGIAAPAL